MPWGAVPEQGKASPEDFIRSRYPPEWGRGALETALRWLGLGAFVGFAAWSAWEFVSYTRVEGAPFYDRRACPNSLAVGFTLREYLETFGPWRGWQALPWEEWIAWVLRIAAPVTLIATFGSGALLAGAVLGVASLCTLLVIALTAALCSPPFADGGGWILLIITSIVVGGRIARGKSLRVRRALWSRLPRRLSPGRVLAVLSLGLLLTLSFLSTSTPAIESDGLRYHLGAPQAWLEAGVFAALPGLAFGQFPFLIEMTFLPLLRFGDEVAKLAHFTFFLLTLLLLGSFTRRLAHWAGLPPRLRGPLPLLAVALAATIPALTIVSTWAFTDAGVVCYHVAATFALALWWHSGRGSQLVLAAVLAGFALGTKYTALVPVFVLGLGVLCHGRPALGTLPYTGIERLTNALVFGLIALALGSPWYIRNWVQTGNPFFPLANETFRAPGWPPESQALWEEKAAQKGVGFDWHLLDEAWWGATFRWAGNAPGETLVGPGGFEDQSIGLTPWLLAPLGLAGMALIALRRGGWWWFHLLFTASNFALWFRTYQSNRLLLPALMIALPGAVVGLAWLTQRWRPLWRAALIALSIAAGYQGLWIARYLLTEECPLQLALGFWDADDHRAQRLSHFGGTRAIRALVPEGERVLVIGETRRHHFPANVVMSDWFDPPAVRRFLESAQSPEGLTAALASEGITHVFLNHAELGIFRGEWLGESGAVDPGAYWQAWLTRDPAIPPGSNLAWFRRRFGDREASLLAQWLATVPHRVVWHDPNWPGVELWALRDAPRVARNPRAPPAPSVQSGDSTPPPGSRR